MELNGLKNSPQIMQRIMNTIFGDMKGMGVEVYIDDIVVHSKNEKYHDWLLREVLKRLKRNKMGINSSKVQFKQEKVKLLGVTIDGKEQTPNEIKKNEALVYPRPNSLKELRRFLGLCGWFRQFIRNYAELTRELTEGLKTTNRQWQWTDKMEQGFINVKEKLKQIKGLLLPNYKKEFLLRTDASNSGMGAVLLQQNEEEKWCPVQWASKKFTPAEVRYSISEKEMYAITWGIEKFSYELRGRRFHLETDHIRRKPFFKNNRINRWMEKIQEYDFTIKYQKGDGDALVIPDALSRVYEGQSPKNIKSEKIKEGKILKHAIEKNGKTYWKFDSGEEVEIPEISERKEMVIKKHEELAHRGVETIYRRDYYWPGMKETIVNVIKRCEVCGINNRKKLGGSDYVTTVRKLEKVAIDLIDIREEGKYVLVAIDYYSRGIWTRVIDTKDAGNVVDVLSNWFRGRIKPEEIISDNGKEFANMKFKTFCKKRRIRHRMVSVESHRSNGRVERVIGTLREGLVKIKGNTLEERVEEITRAYNNTYHSGIRCTPREAWKDETNIAMIENNREGKYIKQFKKTKREKFKIGDRIRIAKKRECKGG
jgi:RNase H-like domain found in reverse transcriptase/Reverse transcriptase (RNA-dependent DNA polymerase)/Integrase core domain/Integrase zinc binding domain